jgi:fibronectin type 3 domain-containing protein
VGGKRKATVTWGAVAGVAGYKVYYAQGGKYTLRATVTGTSYTDSSLSPGNTYCYAVTAFVNCAGGAMGESGYSNTACAVPTR